MSDRVGEGLDFAKNKTFSQNHFIQFCFTFTIYYAIIFLRKMLHYLTVFGI